MGVHTCRAGGVIHVEEYQIPLLRTALLEAHAEGVREEKDCKIEHMVNRFLGWKLPENFSPDAGIEFDPDGAKKLNPRNSRREPYGTNLFNYQQARAMVEYMLDNIPQPPNILSKKFSLLS